MQLDLLNHEVQAERAARDRSMNNATDKADNADKSDASCVRWSVTALSFFIDFAATAQGPFMTEDVRMAAEAVGLSAPPDRRAWGSIAMAAFRQKIIKRIGYGPQQSKGCHCAPKTIWKRV